MSHDQFISRGDLQEAAVGGWRSVFLLDQRLWVRAIFVARRNAETGGRTRGQAAPLICRT